MGIVLGYQWGVPLWMVLLCLAALAVFALRNKNEDLTDAALVVFCLLAGIFYVQIRGIQPADHITHSSARLKGKVIEVSGTVLDHPRDAGSRAKLQRFILGLESLSDETACRKVSGKILVRMYAPLDVRRGSRVVLNGKIHAPFEFSLNAKTSYQQYLKRKNIQYVLSVARKNSVGILSHPSENIYGRLQSFRQKLLGIFEKYLSAEEGYFMGALLLGERSRLSSQVQAVFEKTGTAHILAISGLHVGMVIGIIFVLLSFFPVGLKMRSLLTGIFIFAYAVMIGSRPSVIRAVVMATSMLGSFVFERKGSGLNALGLAGLVLMVMDPLCIFDIGFQLSFLAVLSILVFFPLLERRASGMRFFRRDSFAESVWHSWIVSFSAWMGVTGAIMYYFEYISLSALFANIIIVPLVGVVLGLGIFLLAAGLASSSSAWAVAAVLQAVLRFMVWVASLASQVPHTFFKISGVSLKGMCVYYSALWLIWLLLRTLRGRGVIDKEKGLC